MWIRRLFSQLFCFSFILIPASIQASDEILPVTSEPWQEAVVSVTDTDATARFFIEIGGYDLISRGAINKSALSNWGMPQHVKGEYVLLGMPGREQGKVRLLEFQNTGRREPMRPGSRAWDTGCYFSLMVRVKDMQAIYDDAIRLGWWTETPITPLKFGTSKLNVVIYRGPDGVQVQAYERIEPPLGSDIPDFDRMTSPFNIMQMVRDRDVSYNFFTQVLGFGTFYKGKPYTAKVPTPTPIGIPLNLTTSIPYRAGIVFPRPGEFGRMEMIEVIGLEGADYSDRCHAPNLGILAIRFPVDSVKDASTTIIDRGWSLSKEIDSITLNDLGRVKIFSIKTPDGAIIQFYES